MSEYLELSVLKELALKDFAPQLKALQRMPRLEVNEIEDVLKEADLKTYKTFQDLRKIFNF